MLIKGRFWNATKIKFLRNRLGLSREKLAKKLNCKMETVKNWENDIFQPSQDSQDKLTYLARQSGISFTLEDLDFKTLLICIDDILAELKMNWLAKEPKATKNKRTLALKVAKLKQARDEICWEDFIYRI